jgi:hypothetical protein
MNPSLEPPSQPRLLPRGNRPHRHRPGGKLSLEPRPPAQGECPQRPRPLPRGNRPHSPAHCPKGTAFTAPPPVQGERPHRPRPLHRGNRPHRPRPLSKGNCLHKSPVQRPFPLLLCPWTHFILLSAEAADALLCHLACLSSPQTNTAPFVTVPPVSLPWTSKPCFFFSCIYHQVIRPLDSGGQY